MGSKQIVLYIFVILLVVIATTQGFSYYKVYEQNHNRDQLIANINSLYASAKEFKTKPEAMGGGNGSYENWVPKTNLNFPDIGLIKYIAYENRINFFGTGIIEGDNGKDFVKVFIRFRDDKKDFIKILN